MSVPDPQIRQGDESQPWPVCPMRQPDGSESFGQEALDFDIAKADSQAQKAILQLWSQQPLVLIRNQLLSEQQLMNFSRLFGELECVVRKDIHSPYNPEVVFVSNLYLEDGTNIGALGSYELRWHTDQSYRTRPATGAVFFAIEVPPEGGNTRWVDTRAAWRELDEETRELIEGRRGLFAYQMYDTDITEEPEVQSIRERTPDACHPLVLSHPRSGEKSLYFDPTQTYGIEGMDAEQSNALVERLRSHITQPHFIAEHQWRMGDVMLWDNARLLHTRRNFDPHFPRLAKRTTIFLDQRWFPVPAASGADLEK